MPRRRSEIERNLTPLPPSISDNLARDHSFAHDVVLSFLVDYVVLPGGTIGYGDAGSKGRIGGGVAGHGEIEEGIGFRSEDDGGRAGSCSVG